MSILSDNKNKSQMAQMMDQVQTAMSDRMSGSVIEDTAKDLFSLESIDASNVSALQNELSTIGTDLEESLSWALEGLNPAERAVALEVAAMTAVATIDGEGFVESFKRHDSNGISFEGADYTPGIDVSFEAFDNQKLDNFRVQNVILNCITANGDRFSEAFYPTHAVAPGETGWELSIKQEALMGDTLRKANGDVTDFGKQRLIDAKRNYKLLTVNNAAETIPMIAADGSNADKFVDEAVFPVRETIADGEKIKTNLLKMGVKVDLIAVAEGYGEIKHQRTNANDQLDPHLSLREIGLVIKTGSGDGAAEEGVVINVNNFQGTQYVAAQQGRSRDVTLSFNSSRIALNKETTKLADGTVPAALDAFFTAGYSAFLEVAISAQANLEYASNNPMASVSLAKVFKDGQEIAITDAGVQAALSGATFVIDGYSLNSRRTNSNFRNRGITAATTSRRQKYVLPYGSPLHVVSSLEDASNGVGISTLINMANVRSSNNSVTALFRQAEQLKAYQAGQEVEGITADLLNPTYIEEVFDAMTVVNAETSAERGECLKQALIDKIRVVTYDLVRKSGYRTALELETGNRSAKVIPIIGTDEVTEQHLMVTGDERTLSVGVDKFIVVTTEDERMYDEIFIALSCGREAGLDAFNHGTRGFMPAPTIELKVSKDGEQLKETIVRPRDMHVNNVPVLARIKVRNLQEYLGKGSAKLVSHANEPRA